MANVHESDKKVSAKKIQDHIMLEAEKVLGGKTSFGFRFDSGAAELHIECEDPNKEGTTYWHIFNNDTQIKGWRLLIFRCPIGYLESFKSRKDYLTICPAGDLSSARDSEG